MEILDKRSASNPFVAWHVGRHGEVAGGMTQVVNGYLGWSFERFVVKVLATRDGSKWIRAFRVFFAALVGLLKIKDIQRNMFVVHLSQGGSFVREGLILRLASARGFGVVAHIHGSRFVDFASRFPWLVKFVLSAASRVIVLSDATFEKIAELIPRDRIELIPNAVPLGEEEKKESLIVFGGSVSYRKGVDVLVQAWSAVKDKRDWKLKIAGPIANTEIIPVRLEDVEFLGAISHSMLMQLLQRSSVAVLPSRDEAMPMFILEAMARNNCVISTRVGGIPNLLSEDRGVLVDAGDVIQLVEAIERVIHDEEFRQKVASLGRISFNESYSAETVYPRLEKLWLSVIPKIGS